VIIDTLMNWEEPKDFMWFGPLCTFDSWKTASKRSEIFNAQKEAAIAEALNADEGRIALARAMIERK
jgi:hypothetical protein